MAYFFTVLVASTDFIRWSGLAAMAGGVLYSTLGLFLGYRAPLLYALLALGAMAATAAMHALHKGHYGSSGALASLITFVGLAMVFASTPMRWLSPSFEAGAIVLFLLGLLAASAGTVALGAVTVATRTLPWWCGVGLMVGGLGFLVGLVGDWVVGASSSGYFVVVVLLQGGAWALVGYAVFRAGRRAERPSRVR